MLMSKKDDIYYTIYNHTCSYNFNIYTIYIIYRLYTDNEPKCKNIIILKNDFR